MGFLNRLFGRTDAARTDALRIYNTVMSQARLPEFYGANRAADNYDGRIDILSLHLSIVIRALNRHGEHGKRLAQAVYEVMRDDWDVALREEGMSDTGTMKRIKPMIRLFYTRMKAYTDGIDAGSIEQALHVGVLARDLDDVETDENSGNDIHGPFVAPLSAYAMACVRAIDGKTLGQIALAEFDFPHPPQR